MQLIQLKKPWRIWATAFIYTQKESYKIQGELQDVKETIKNDLITSFWGYIYTRKTSKQGKTCLIVTSKELYIKRIFKQPHIFQPNRRQEPGGFIIYKKFLGRWIPLKKLRRLPKGWIKEFEISEFDIEIAKDKLKEEGLLAWLVMPRPKKKGKFYDTRWR